VRRQDTSGQDALVGSPYVGASDIDLSTPHPPQFLLEDQSAVRWRDTTNGITCHIIQHSSGFSEADLIQFNA
jgi:hypothetical protein